MWYLIEKFAFKIYTLLFSLKTLKVWEKAIFIDRKYKENIYAFVQNKLHV